MHEYINGFATNLVYCDDLYRCRQEYRPRLTTFDLFYTTILKITKEIFALRFVDNRPFYSCVFSYLAMNASEAGGDLNKTEQDLPKQQQKNKTKFNPPDTQHQLLCINWTCIQYWLTTQC